MSINIDKMIVKQYDQGQAEAKQIIVSATKRRHVGVFVDGVDCAIRC